MTCGMFGKLPLKRDFVSVNTPREFLHIWETWLQGGISASRLKLGTGWQQVYLGAPIWRFWLGPDICGFPVVGSFMPSIDGVGRYFPLTAYFCGAPEEIIPAPPDDPQGVWYGQIEEFLLDALDAPSDYDGVLSALNALPNPALALAPEADPADIGIFGAHVRSAETIEQLPDTLVTLLAQRHQRIFSNASFWWTIGGEGFEPHAAMADGLPDPNIMSGMLTGRFEQDSGVN